MSNQVESSFRWFLWLGVTIFVVAAAITGLVLLKTGTPRRITVRVDTNGVTRLGDVPLLSTNIRDGTFATMDALGLKASLAVPPLTNGDPRVSNVLETLKSMSKAGLFTTNKPPNPYE